MSTPGEKSLEQRGMTMRVAQPGDLARILEIVEAARAFLAAEGIDQWQKGTPAPSDFERDIELGWGRVVVLDDQIVGYAALIDGPEPYYGFVYSGEWHPRPGSHGVVTPPDDYYTIHRVAIATEARGLGLHDLRTAHLAARGGDERVEGHILALEGRDTIAVLPEDPAEGGGEQTLARVGHRPLQHQIQRHDSSSIPRRRASSSASFSSGSRTAVRYQPSPRPV